ncbi:xanthine dehydrogenase accessory protein XdhC [Aeoliella sp. SH292]|uniref:xanthine dehydrogenase accessory protein XdhC n=1 Tax=Aeoliella sp. SH292 TaxID=3454464 RepID=UPI003F9665F0
MSEPSVLRRSAELAETQTPFVMVTLVEAIGSTPQDVGAKMLVSGEGLVEGTVGGGRVEAKAIEHAQAMLLVAERTCAIVDWSLKADVGMTCGGRVKLLFESFGVVPWRIVVFGAGHVAQALVRILVTLPCQVTCIDSRQEWLARLPAGVGLVESSHPEEHVDAVDENTFVVCMTQGHRTDLPVLQRIYSSGRAFPFVGVIGSRAKAAVLRKELAEAGIDPAKLDFHCPVGLDLGTNHSAEIAVSIAAQLLAVRDAKSAK